MSNRSRSERFSRVPGPFRVRVVSRRTLDGQTFYTAVNVRTSEVFPWCLLLSESGGSSEVFVHAPIALPADETNPFEAPEALLTFDVKGAAYLSGLSPSSHQAGAVSQHDALDDSDPHPGTFTPQDFVAANGPARLHLDAEGNVLLKGARTLRLQVGNPDTGEGGQVMVFSTEGDAQSRVVLLDPLREYLTETLSAQIDALSRVLEQICTTMAASGSSTGFVNPFTLPTAPRHTHVPLEAPSARIASPFLSAPQGDSPE